MGRSASCPQLLPIQPGDWLACIRYRTLINGRHPSRAVFGDMLGYSEATVRRWESGARKPGREDLDHLAESCHLSPTEVAFLDTALKNQSARSPISPDAVRHRLELLLSTPFAAYVMDDLFYLRGVNGAFRRLFARPFGTALGRNLLVVWLENEKHIGSPDGLLMRLLRSFWYHSAANCGLEPYQCLLRELQQFPHFVAAWERIAMAETDFSGPIDQPYCYSTRDDGLYRVYPLRVDLPQPYHLREYAPVDELSLTRIHSISDQPPEVDFDRYLRWAEEPRDQVADDVEHCS